MFKGSVKALESAVINLDDSTGPGTHFSCYYNDPQGKHIEYFDSYGAVPPKNIEKYLRTSGKKIAWNTSQYQPIDSVLCGFYCIYFIQERAKGNTMFEVLSKFDINDPEANDMFIREYFNL